MREKRHGFPFSKHVERYTFKRPSGEAGRLSPDLTQRLTEQLPHDGGLNAPQPQPPKDSLGVPGVSSPAQHAGEESTGGFVSRERAFPRAVYGDWLPSIELPPLAVKREVEGGYLPKEVAEEMFEEYRRSKHYPWKKELLELEEEAQREEQLRNANGNILELFQPQKAMASQDLASPAQQTDDEVIDLSMYRGIVGHCVMTGLISPEEARDLLRGKNWDNEQDWNEA